MSELVERLAKGLHAVEVSLRPEKTLEAFQECLNRGYVHVRFTETRGGTELGLRLDRERTRVDGADFAGGTGTVRLVGHLSLDWIPVVCVADINLAGLTGTGQLDIVSPT